MKTSKMGVITVKEDFMQVGTKSMDSKSRVSLGGKTEKILLGKIKADFFKVYIGQNGDVLLRPSVGVPSREAWLFEDAGVYTKVKRGLREAKEGKVSTVKDLEVFLQGL